MKFRYFVFLLSAALLFSCKSATKSNMATSIYLPKSNGKDQTNIIQQAIDKASRENRILIFPKNQHYKISRALQIGCSIDGQNSKLIPTHAKSEVMRFTKPFLTIENLHVSGEAAGYIQVNKTNTTFRNCHFDISSYFILFSVNADNLSLINCKLINKHHTRHQFAIHSITSINNLKIDSCYIFGGILLENVSQSITGNHSIKNSEIMVDYTHADQNYMTQHDGITLKGINTIEFVNNVLTFRNVNRSIKCTDITKKHNPKEISKFTTTNVLFKKNKIDSRSSNGKQVLDLYAGTGLIQFLENEISSTGHTTVFENKTTEFAPLGAQIIIRNNNINFDFKLLYVNGGYLSEPKSGSYRLILESNHLTNNSKAVIKEVLHKGQDFPTPFGHLIDVRNYHEFKFDNNKLSTSNGPIYSAYNFLYLQNVKNTIFTNNHYQGGIVFDSADPEAQMLFKSNVNEGINMVSAITAHRLAKGSIIAEDNEIKSSNPKINITNEKLNSNIKPSNNKIRQL